MSLVPQSQARIVRVPMRITSTLRIAFSIMPIYERIQGRTSLDPDQDKTCPVISFGAFDSLSSKYLIFLRQAFVNSLI